LGSSSSSIWRHISADRETPPFDGGEVDGRLATVCPKLTTISRSGFALELFTRPPGGALRERSKLAAGSDGGPSLSTSTVASPISAFPRPPERLRAIRCGAGDARQGPPARQGKGSSGLGRRLTACEGRSWSSPGPAVDRFSQVPRAAVR
jgi:hypothetical protein